MPPQSPPSPTIPPLPWDFFEFQGPLTPLPPRPRRQHDSYTTFAITLDHRPIPFKLLSKGTHRPLLILLHGMGLTIASFRAISGYLFQTHDLALVDYSSLSSREWPPGGVAIKVMAETVWKIADAAATDNFSLAGNSLGGGLCLIAALLRTQDPRLKKILLSNPACFPQTLPHMYQLARVPLLGELVMTITPARKLIVGIEHIGYVDKSRFDPALKAHYTRLMSQRKNRFRLMDLIRHLPADARDLTPALHLPRLHEISQPTLITWGEQDPLLSESAGLRLAKALPHATFIPFPTLSHMPHEEAPDEIGPLWLNFLNAGNSNDEARMTNQIRMTKFE